MPASKLPPDDVLLREFREGCTVGIALKYGASHWTVRLRLKALGVYPKSWMTWDEYEDSPYGSVDATRALARLRNAACRK